MKSATTIASLLLGTPATAGGARLAGGIAGFLVIAGAPLLSFTSVMQLSRFVLLGLVWLGCAFCGVNLLALWSYWRHGLSRPYEWRPSWTRSVWCAVLASSLAAMFLLPRESWATAFLAVGVATNVAYAGAKAGCSVVGCCRSRRVLLLTNILPPRLQTCEMCASLILATAATVPVALGGSLAASGTVAFVGHAVVRGFSGWLRFPSRTAWSFVGDVGAGGFALLGVGIGFLLGRG